MIRKHTLGAAAATVLLLAGCSAVAVDEHDPDAGHGEQAGEVHDDVHDHAESTPPIEGAPQTRITADAMAFEPGTLEFGAGEEHNLTLRSTDSIHDLTIDEIDFHVAADAGEAATGGAVFEEAGTYLAYCSVPGHRQAGMEMVITVR